MYNEVFSVKHSLQKSEKTRNLNEYLNELLQLPYLFWAISPAGHRKACFYYPILEETLF